MQSPTKDTHRRSDVAIQPSSILQSKHWRIFFLFDTHWISSATALLATLPFPSDSGLYLLDLLDTLNWRAVDTKVLSYRSNPLIPVDTNLNASILKYPNVSSRAPDKFRRKRNLKISIAKRRFSFSVNLKLRTLLDLFYFRCTRILIRNFVSSQAFGCLNRINGWSIINMKLGFDGHELLDFR